MKLATFDIETTPFQYGVEPVPFLAVIYTLDFTKTFWGDDCLEQCCKFIYRSMTGYSIYAHNGGKFDYNFLMRKGYLTNPLSVIGGRIAQAKIGSNTVLDSLLLYPMALANYQKDEIDYGLFVKTKREKHKEKITEYCINDCKYLYNLLSEFFLLFGKKLTIGQAAFGELKKHTRTLPKTKKPYDDKFRNFYYGGRCQAFKTGHLKGNFNYYDVNSLYPFAMKFQHFNSKSIAQVRGSALDGKGYFKKDKGLPYFAKVKCKNKNALCFKGDDGLLDFTKREGTFFTSGFEIQAAIRNGLISDIEYLQIFVCFDPVTFPEFVDKYYYEKSHAKTATERQFYKLILNSAYGKFGQNSNNFFEYYIKNKNDDKELDNDFLFYSDSGEVDIYRKPNPDDNFNDVAVASSITGKARAIMLDYMSVAVNLVYMDTDSLVCESIPDEFIHPIKLGLLDKQYQDLDDLYIGGKKLYEFYSKGVLQVAGGKGFRVCAGDIITLIKEGKLIKPDPVPKFNLGKQARFITKTLLFQG